jgi:HD-like signal output (HDOD) protein
MTELNIPLPAQNLDFDLPSVRQITFELIQLLNSDEADMSDIVAVIKLDPVLTGRIISYANSPFQAPLRPITSLENAVIRTGRHELKKIFYRTVMRDAFANVHPDTESVMEAIWVHSLTASLAMDKLRLALEDRLELDDAEYDFLSTLGILHNIGFLVLHHNFRRKFKLLFLDDPPMDLDGFLEHEQGVFRGVDHCLAGKYMLDRWYFPSFMGQAALTCFDALDDRPENHLGIMLRISNYLAVQTGMSFFPDNPPDFWLRGLPASWDMEPVLAIVPALAREVSLHQNILA